MTAENLDRYRAAMHAMQTGVKMLLSRDAPSYEHTGIVPESQECSPKHLRVGVNSALIDSGTILELLIERGVITRDDFEAKLADYAERDATSYKQRLGLPPNVHLG